MEPTWQTIDGVPVLRIGDEPVAALPATGRKTAARFVMFDVVTRVEICQILKAEVRGWLWHHATGRAKDAAAKVAAKQFQRERVMVYLAVRAARTPAPVQLNLF